MARRIARLEEWHSPDVRSMTDAELDFEIERVSAIVAREHGLTTAEVVAMSLDGFDRLVAGGRAP